jgi:hypothetical protein
MRRSLSWSVAAMSNQPRSLAILVALAAGLAEGGCEGGAAWPPSAEPAAAGNVVPRDGHALFPPAGTPVYALQVGGEVRVSPGLKIGYSLTAKAPGSYRFRWTGDDAVTRGGFHKFYGSVWTTGHFTSLVPGCDDGSCPLEPEGDYVSGVLRVDGGERIDWHTFASDGWDGFSFTTDTEPVYFDVNVENGPHPDLFEFPSAAAHGAPSAPASNPFGIASGL